MTSVAPEIAGTRVPTLQPSFDELSEPLRETTFVVVDLETTGGSARTERITEIGAVKVRGGQVLGEFATLVDPGRSIPPNITILTGITNAMVVGAPRIDSVLPSFLEFSRNCVLVAHNAGFDMGFLRAACQRLGLPWPAPRVIDTVRLARSALSKDEAPSVRLGALAPLLGATVRPDHRALTDARATVDVLHALFERLGAVGVQSMDELVHAQRRVSTAQRRKRHLAQGLPAAPGVYLFRGAKDEVLYVGTSKNLRQRVRSYFGRSEQRRRIRHMVTLAERVDHVVCAHSLEAQVREQRLIAAHQPRYNRRSKQPHRGWWVVLTSEAFPRLSVVPAQSPQLGRTANPLGPFWSRAAALEAVDALHSAVRIRRCTQRIRRHDPDGTACALAELGKCGAPCAGLESVTDYAAHVMQVTGMVAGSNDDVLTGLHQRVVQLGSAGRFDDAATARDRLAALASVLHRGQRLAALCGIAELVAARPDGSGGWEFSVIRHGRLAGAGVARRGVAPMPIVHLLQASAETVRPAAGPLPAASAEETSTILAWLDQPGTRLVSSTQPWSLPARAAGRWQPFVDAAAVARGSLSGADLRRHAVTG
ncbi:DEDD exonuclease domain-containing protein [Nakamurella aerolata]|uniref:DEDD exonuclease domain-containing protein n=1 Tax=Nakamurella aerolata TaxID=1656892 RepID=UPI0031B5F08F